MFLVYEFPNANANLIPVGKIKSQVDKGINSKMFKVTISDNFNTQTNSFIPGIKRKSVKKPLLLYCFFCYVFWTRSDHFYIKKHRY